MTWLAIVSFLKRLATNKWTWIVLFVLASVFTLYKWHRGVVADEIKVYAAQRDADDADDAEVLRLAQKQQAVLEKQHAKDIETSQQRAFLQAQKDEKVIANLRADVSAGVKRLRTYSAYNSSANNPSPYPPSGTADNATSAAVARGIATDSERVIRITEIGLLALKNWQEAQDTIIADRKAIEQEESK